MQSQKGALATAALDGGDFVKANKLSLSDIMYLFTGDPNTNPKKARVGI